MARLILFGSQFYCKPYLTSGWSSPERDIVWSDAGICKLALPSHPLSNTAQISINFHAYLPPGLSSQRINVSQNGRNLLSNEAFSSGYLEIQARKSTSASALIELEFEFPDALSPAGGGKSNDERKLAIALRKAIVSDIFPEPSRRNDSNLFAVDVHRSNIVSSIWQIRLEDSQKVNYLCDQHDRGIANLHDMISGYIAGVGSEMHIRRRLAEKIIIAGKAQGEEEGLFSRQLVLNHDSELVISNELSDFVATSSSYPAVEQRLWKSQPNILRVETFPVEYGAPLTSPTIPGFSIFESIQYDIRASAYNFCISHKYTNSFLKDVISQDLSLPQADCPKMHVSGRAILLQDRFDGGNIAHFLFDAMTRMFHYVETFGASDNDLFVFGGTPNEFHEIIISKVCKHYGLPRENIFFPAHMVHFQADEGSVWFSDQMSYCHPSQRMHPRSIAALKSIARLCGQSICSGRRLYISRSDAGLRRLENEDEIHALVSEFGFEKITLSNYSYREQIEIMSSASHIVAPHGMGLTHLAMNLHRPTLIELFNPEIGSDAYAWMAFALNFNYHPIAGKQTDQRSRNFSILPEALREILADNVL